MMPKSGEGVDVTFCAALREYERFESFYELFLVRGNMFIDVQQIHDK